MKYPKMIIFDYGNTLLYEPGFDTSKGTKAIFNYIKNKKDITPELIIEKDRELFNLIGSARNAGFEIHEHQYLNLLYDYLGIEFTVSKSEIERIFWDNCSYGAVMPGADKMIDFINSHGIRSGVISNIAFSGKALENRINRLLPNNRFEFVIASSEYALRKPSKYLFETALKKANLSSDDVWFCGDNVTADVLGAAGAGIFPVWYEETNIENPWRDKSGKLPDCEHLHIHSWDELTDVLSIFQHETNEKSEKDQCTIKFYEPDSVPDEKLKFAVIYSEYDGKHIFCRHKERTTWEIPGGHRENGETIEDAAKRELYEESGAVKFDLRPVCIYSVTQNSSTTYGMLFYADIKELSDIPQNSEIGEINFFDHLPEKLTYPNIQNVLFTKICNL